ncbi:hypothetical protein E8E01_19865 [Methylorubrum populi]|uniref:hypothetical protein n=1 Tax=Methylorubrum populi TaxID=223967 RepID=UPI0011511307|nr:hypothetical protein [Methylorubrum populi]QDI82512.1 hypothetical protein E8E01_19865 [Methylorubrum populi]
MSVSYHLCHDLDVPPIMFPRKLTYRVEDRTVELTSSDLSARAEPLVILGEAGMGKTTLLDALADREGFRRINASRFASSRNPRLLVGNAQVVVLDALDEAIASREGETVDRVLAALEDIGRPRFILACRVADWRSATATQRVLEAYGEKPLELHLQPLDGAQAQDFLTEAVGEERAAEIVSRFEEQELSEWLGNPQTLMMIARVASKESLPETTGDLFERYVDLTWEEHSEYKADTELRKAGREVVLDALGAAFAALILNGKVAISRVPSHVLEQDCLSAAEIAALPAAAQIENFLGSRLISAKGPNSFTYQHRRIGEFLGARWLAKQCSRSPRKRRRLLAIFRERGVVPTGLRGLHAWLARDSEFALDVITADPMGVIEYGDADSLSVHQGRALIAALERYTADHPRFIGWGSYRVSGIARPELVEDLRRLITAPSTPYGLRILLLKAAANSPISKEMAADFRTLMLSDTELFGARSIAASALGDLGTDDDWAALGEALRAKGDANSTRLAVELLRNVGFSHFKDGCIVEILFAQAGVSLCSMPRSDPERIGGLFIRFWDDLPDERIDGVLNTFASYADALLDRESSDEHGELADVAVELIARRVQLGNLTGAQLWRWLAPLDEGSVYRDRSRRILTEALRSNASIRREIQRHVLLERQDDKDIWSRSIRLTRPSAALEVMPEDALALLDALDPADEEDERWRGVVELVRHGGEQGSEVRVAARRFAEHSGDLLEWLDGLASPPTPDWQIKQERRRSEERSKREARWQAQRADFEKHKLDMRAGAVGCVLPPAQAYLRLFSDIGRELPAHERIAEWLGEDLQTDAFTGFEAFLQTAASKPLADEIAEGFASNQRWNSTYILIAALAERLRTGKGFHDLSDERITAGLLSIQHGALDRHAGIDGLRESLEEALRLRQNAWENYLRLLIEPNLRARAPYISGLHELMHSKQDSSLATDLAIEWLSAHSDALAEIEEPMIDRLVHSGAVVELASLAARRITSADDRQRRNWAAIDLLTNFEAASHQLTGIGLTDRDFLWALRHRLGGKRGSKSNVYLEPGLLSWIIREFRAIYPAQGYPAGGWSGDTNPWDASEYLMSLISRLGSDTSDAAIGQLEALCVASIDTYSEHLRSTAAEQRAKRAEIDYRSPGVAEISSILTLGSPLSAKDLQAVMLDELAAVQSKIKADDAESWRGFFGDNGVPYNEERCRDHLLGLLRQGCEGIELVPEVHVAADKEVDIGCHVGSLFLPIEIKGQWHTDLWHAADTQLERLYSTDWRADRRGIYLVFWFGPDVASNKRLKVPSGRTAPQTPEDLRDQLAAGSKSAQEGRVEICILDLTRPK